MNPCGVAAGDSQPGGIPLGGNPPYKFKVGTDPRGLEELPGKKTVWKANGVAEIQWALIANHGSVDSLRMWLPDVLMH